MTKPRFFTGITATGTLTLGHYLGVIKHILSLQDEYEVVIMVADLHALTIPMPDFDYQGKVHEIVALLYSCGLKEDCKIFVQSQIKEHLELSWILAPLTTVSELNNMIQYKEKKKSDETGNLALLSYPVLMAADIFLYDADLVIVGQDQEQHLELTKSIVRKINNFYQEKLLKLPKLTIPNIGAKIMGLQNPNGKMSKSSKSGKDYIALLDSPEIISQKISLAKTDSENEIYYQLEKKPGISNLLVIYSLLQNRNLKDIEKEFFSFDYQQFKKKLIETINSELKPIQEKFNYYQKIVGKLLSENKTYLQEIAKNKINLIKKKMKFVC